MAKMNFEKGGEATKLKNLTTNVLKNWIGFIKYAT